jgi:hypothetical protein
MAHDVARTTSQERLRLPEIERHELRVRHHRKAAVGLLAAFAHPELLPSAARPSDLADERVLRAMRMESQSSAHADASHMQPQVAAVLHKQLQWQLQNSKCVDERSRGAYRLANEAAAGLARQHLDSLKHAVARGALRPRAVQLDASEVHRNLVNAPLLHCAQDLRGERAHVQCAPPWAGYVDADQRVAGRDVAAAQRREDTHPTLQSTSGCPEDDVRPHEIGGGHCKQIHGETAARRG